MNCAPGMWVTAKISQGKQEGRQPALGGAHGPGFLGEEQVHPQEKSTRETLKYDSPSKAVAGQV